MGTLKLFDGQTFYVIEDSGWGNGYSGGRCITDYYRSIEFTRKLSDEKVGVVKKQLAGDDCPGWTGVCLSRVEGLKYTFSTTMDASD